MTGTAFRHPLARAFRRDRRGNVAMTTALCAPLFLALGAVAIDEGSLFNERRVLQNLADLAAITAAAHPDQPEKAVLTTLADNKVSATITRSGAADPLIPLSGGTAQARVVSGRYSDALSVAVDKRFVPGAEPANAFRVTLRRRAHRFFANQLLPNPIITVEATAHAAPEAAFTVGSRLARLEGGIANSLLGALLGGRIDLTVMDYRALLDARLDLFDTLDALATRLDLRAGTYADLLDAVVTLPDLLDAAADAASAERPASAALHKAARGADRRRLVPMRALFDLGAAAPQPVGFRLGGVATKVSATGLLSAAGGAAQDGKQVEVTLAAAMPGLLDATLLLAIGERAQGSPWVAVGETGATVRTAQTRFLLTLRLGGASGVLGTTVTLPVYAELAFAEATLTDIRCAPGQPKPTTVQVAARPGIAELRIAEPAATRLDDFKGSVAFRPARLLATPLLKVTGSSLVTVSEPAPKRLDFTTREIEAGTAKTVSTRNLLTSPLGSLADHLDLDIEAGGGAIGLSGLLGPALDRTLGEIAEPVDTLLFAVLDTLGLSLGEADVTVNGGTCRRAVLVQ